MQSKRQGRPSRRSALMAMIAFGAMVVVGAAYFVGPFSIVMVSGDSMEPALNDGDLAILRRASQYEVGDAAAYEHPDVGLLLHRVVAREEALAAVGGAGLSPGANTGPDGDGRLVLQGDNRLRADPYHPLPSEIQGVLVASVPGGGSLVEMARQPGTVAAAGGIVALIALWPLLGTAQRRGRVRRRLVANAPAVGAPVVVAAIALTAVGAAAVVANLRAFGTTHEVAVPTTYQQTATLNYEAPGGDGLYDTALARSGDPVFRALADAMTVRLDYRFESQTAPVIEGSYRLLARLGHANGWTRTIELMPERKFDTVDLSGSAALDFRRLEALSESFREQTGIETDPHLLSVIAEVSVAGTLAGQPFADALSMALDFLLDPIQLRLAVDPGGGDPFTTARTGAVTNMVVEDIAVGMAGFSFRVADARVPAIIVLGVSLLALAGIAAVARFRGEEGELAKIRARHGSLLVPATLGELPREAVLVEVSRFSDLVRMARLEGLPIVDEEADVGTRFLLIQRDVTYYYRSGGQQASEERPVAPKAA